jgi:hypothetical protein
MAKWNIIVNFQPKERICEASIGAYWVYIAIAVILYEYLK